jgi:hypothetical protein
MRALGLRSVRWAGLAVLLCGWAAALGQGYTPVTVVVTDPSGAGIAGAEIRVTPGSPAGDRLITDEHGRAQLGIPAGKYQIEVTAQGFSSNKGALEVADKAQTMTVTLTPAPASSGKEVGPAPMQPSAVPLESTVEKPHAEARERAGASGRSGDFGNGRAARGVHGSDAEGLSASDGDDPRPPHERR